jgi:hypothetical protein
MLRMAGKAERGCYSPATESWFGPESFELSDVSGTEESEERRWVT